MKNKKLKIWSAILAIVLVGQSFSCAPKAKTIFGFDVDLVASAISSLFTVVSTSVAIASFVKSGQANSISHGKDDSPKVIPTDSNIEVPLPDSISCEEYNTDLQYSDELENHESILNTSTESLQIKVVPQEDGSDNGQNVSEPVEPQNLLNRILQSPAKNQVTESNDVPNRQGPDKTEDTQNLPNTPTESLQIKVVPQEDGSGNGQNASEPVGPQNLLNGSLQSPAKNQVTESNNVRNQQNSDGTGERKSLIEQNIPLESGSPSDITVYEYVSEYCTTASEYSYYYTSSALSDTGSSDCSVDVLTPRLGASNSVTPLNNLLNACMVSRK